MEKKMITKLTKILIILLVNTLHASTDTKISKYKKEAEVIFDSNILFLNDPKVGNHDCEEESVILMDILRSNKKFKDLDLDTQKYLINRRILSPKYERDCSGKIISYKYPNVTDEMRKDIVESSYKRFMLIAKDLLSEEELQDDAFLRGSVGDLGLQRMTTSGGIMILFAYAEKYGIPVVFSLKRIKNDKEIDSTLIPFSYNGSKFVFDESVNCQKPAFFIRMFVDEKRSGKSLENVNMEGFSCGEKNLLTILSRLKDLNGDNYIEEFRKVDPFEFVLLLAAEDDQNNHKRNLKKSKILSKYKEILKIRQKDGAINKESGPYAIADFIPSIRHIYVSNMVEQMF